MCAVVPVISAAYFGFALGVRILSPPESNGGGKAIGLGLLVAFASYATFISIDFIVAALSMSPPHEGEEYVNPLGVLMLFLAGLLYVGWLIALAGGLAGWLLFMISRNRAIRKWLLRESLLRRRSEKVAHVVVLLLLVVSVVPPYVSMRRSRNAELRERKNTALLAAASHGDVSEVQRLINEGADVQLGDNAGWPPIIWAAREGHNEVVKLLLEHGANPNVVETGNSNMTPLHWAATSDNVDCVRMLLENGADVNRSTTYGYTALMMAANSASPQLVQLLLDYKPDLDLRNNEGQTALAFVKVSRDRPSHLDLAGSGNWTDRVTIEKARRRHDEIIRLLESARPVNR